MRTLASIALAALLIPACSSAPRVEEPPSPLAAVEHFYAAPVLFEFTPPERWELPEGEWEEKTGHFSDAFVSRLAVTRRAPISRLDSQTIPPGSALIELIVTEVDRGFFAVVTRRPAILHGEVIITDHEGRVLRAWEVEFRTPDNARYQWYTYGGRIESAHDAFAVDVISWIQRERN
jgi:hypothetical protein